jgi:hypothetical protein
MLRVSLNRIILAMRVLRPVQRETAADEPFTEIGPVDRTGCNCPSVQIQADREAGHRAAGNSVFIGFLSPRFRRVFGTGHSVQRAEPRTHSWHQRCPLIGADRTRGPAVRTAASDPQRTFQPFQWTSDLECKADSLSPTYFSALPLTEFGLPLGGYQHARLQLV